MPLDGEKLDRALVSATVLGTRLALLQTRADATWNEGDHPRAEDGKFGSGGGSAKSLDYKSLKRIGPALGSNPGGRFADPSGKSFYVKQSKSNDHAKNEVTAARLYELAGSPVLRSEPVEMPGGKLGTATEWKDVKNIDRKSPAEVKEAQRDFATHAWLANWDSVGLDYDNQGKIGGKMTTLDVGGSLLYRAQGAPKGNAFGTSAKEWDSLRDPSNRQAHRIFGDMSPEALRESARRVAAVSDEAIRRVVEESGPGSESQKKALADLLIARKADIAKRAGLDVLRADDAGWKESDHPRDADGKFSSMGGAAAKGAAAYKATLSGKKGTVAGLIKHMLMTGKFAEKDVFAAAQEAYGLPDDKKWYPKWYYNNDLKKKGMDPPPIPAESAVEEEPEAKDPGDKIADPEDLENFKLSEPSEIGIIKEKKAHLKSQLENPGGLNLGTLKSAMNDVLKFQAPGGALLSDVDFWMNDLNAHIFDEPDSTKKEVKQRLTSLAGAMLASQTEVTKGALTKIKPLQVEGYSTMAFNKVLAAVQIIYDVEPATAELSKPEAPKTDPAKEALKEAATAFLGTAEEVKDLHQKIVEAIPYSETMLSKAAPMDKEFVSLAEHWDKIQPENQKAVAAQLKYIGGILAVQGEDQVKGMLAMLEPLTGGGMAKDSVNKILAALQNAYGAIPKPAAPAYKPSTPVQQAVYEKAKVLPHARTDSATWLEDHTGAMVKSRLRTDTAKIPGDFYAKVTSAYGSKPDDGLQSAVDSAMQSYTDYTWSQLTSQEQSAAGSYKGSGYQSINANVIASKGKINKGTKAWNVKQAIDKSIIPADTPSFRGLSASLKDLSGFDDAEHSVGRCFEHFNFASTSRNINTSKNFGDKVMLKFMIPAGSKGLPIGGQIGGEREIVLPARSMFRIDKVEQNPTGYGGSAKHLLYCTYLGEREDE